MSITVSAADLQSLEDNLLNKSGNVLLHNRFRALFTLKGLKSDDAVKIISKGITFHIFAPISTHLSGFEDPSALLKHELAYCLGQIKKISAIPALETVLRNLREDPMVRHEAAEALGAISEERSLPILREFLNDSNRSVRETCEIAIAKIEWDTSEEGKRHWNSLDDTNIPYVRSRSIRDDR